MGFTLTRHGSSAVSALRTPEEEAAAKLNHMTLENMPSPVIHGTRPQIEWANKIVRTFLFYSHAWGFKAEEIAAFFKTYRAQSAKFWIDNRNSKPMSSETRIAVEKELAEMAADRAALTKSQAAIAQLTSKQLSKAIGRGV
ncbi:hypothetical protein [Phormidium tenue]|uniref:Uncharacterized protein n=1 Tax=Phormidium tenue FACHB-1050 TaxID=2692857 RepID=A0ABR8C7Y0_9CYAN|nr:hypothetical protein [Phormidium tenue]MBD2316706.1 hypothetical protein [Phormidium tenue FACHB-1050]